MEKVISKEKLGNDLLYDTLCALSGVFSKYNLDLIIVGAAARDIGMKLLNADESKRKTEDLDVAVAIKDWDQYEALTEALKANNFKKLKAKQKFVFKGVDNNNDYEVDVVPFGGLAENELIKWPPMGVPEMSVRCYDDVMSNAQEVLIEDIHVKIAPLAGQFLIKLDTWIDRNDRENKDAIDIRFILSQYYLANIMVSDSIPDVLTFQEGNTLIWGAQWIGYETAKMLSSQHLAYYTDFLETELGKDVESRLLQHLNIGKEENPEEWVSMRSALESMLAIWKDELKNR